MYLQSKKDFFKKERKGRMERLRKGQIFLVLLWPRDSTNLNLQFPWERDGPLLASNVPMDKEA